MQHELKEIICPYCKQRYRDESNLEYCLIGCQKVYYCENYNCGEEFTENLVVKKIKKYIQNK